MGNVHDWHDSVVLEKAKPLELVARAFGLLNKLDCQAQNNGQNGSTVVEGVTGALTKLVEVGEADTAGALLAALEATVDQE